MKILATRTTREGYKRRRYESAGGLRWTTIEVPIEVWNGINRQGRGNDRASAWQRARERDSLRLQAVRLRKAGREMSEVHKVISNVSRRTINRWCKAADEGGV